VFKTNGGVATMSIRITTWKFGVSFGAMLAGLIAAIPASAQTPPPAQQPPNFRCSNTVRNPDPYLPQLKATFRSVTSGPFESEFDCLAWQDFIYLMWPAQANQRGVPDPNRKLGASGPTVWESYRTADTVFLPGGLDPGPWQQPQLIATLQPSLAQQVASGAIRHLTMTSKVSRPVLATILKNAAAFPPPILDSIAEAGGGTLYDLNGIPVYYEVAMDEIQYDYIRQHQLYNAYQQANYARTNVISLPAGTKDAQLGAVEIKAAWKVLSDAERRSGRFHTVQALLPDSKIPVTVGLVGFHIFIVNGTQGAWATFAQTDNAPVGQPATSGKFNFFNPNCKTPGTDKPCPFNVKDASPGQVVQITPDATLATALNTYMHRVLQQDNAKSPWQYYNLIDVQWPRNPKAIADLTAPAQPPLTDGTPNVPPVPPPGKEADDMVNPVLETFLQKPGMSCLLCHQFATTATVAISQTPYAASYSFMFGRASALPADAH
jgi:hypothetical protein